MMGGVSLVSNSTEETMSFGAKLSRKLKAGDIVCLFGDLGSGKTTFVKGLAKGLRIDEREVHSPTFVLMNAYEGKLNLFHFDFYRIEKENEIGSIGYEEFVYGDGVSVIEWAERFGALMPKEHLKIKFKHKGDNKREIYLSFKGQRYQQIIEMIE